MSVLDATEVEARVKELTGWAVDGNALHKVYDFDSYMPGIEFVNRLAGLAEDRNHHPDLEVGYGRVIVRFSTHSEGGITQKDLDLARATDEL